MQDFTEVYDEHVWSVYGFFGYRLNNRADAEDLTQQTFERALKAWSRYDRERAAPQTWLLTIARNLLIDHLRADRSATRTPIGEEGISPDAKPFHTDDTVELGLDPELAAALGELSDRDREVLALRYGGDLTGPEIADLLDLTLANVQQILSRSLRRMRTTLEEAGYAR